MPGGGTTSGARTSVRIVVIGDRGTGKSSLIAAAAAESFRPEVPPVLPPTRLPSDYYPDNVPIIIIDTSSRCASHHIFDLLIFVIFPMSDQLMRLFVDAVWSTEGSLLRN